MKHTKGTVPIFLQKDCPNFSAKGLSQVVIGLTGGVATGKTTVAGIFKKLGCIVISADEIAHELIRPKKRCWVEIVKHFGKGILKEDNTIDRKKLGEIIFSDRKKRKILNKITHQRIIEEIKRKIFFIKTSYSNKKIIIIDAPLLIEADALNLVDKVIIVIAERKTQNKRLLKKNSSLTKTQAKKIVSSQILLSRKIKYADYIIDNSSTLTNTIKQVKLLYNKIIYLLA